MFNLRGNFHPGVRLHLRDWVQNRTLELQSNGQWYDHYFLAIFANSDILQRNGIRDGLATIFLYEVKNSGVS
jgi:hypothetical protein